jgi:hypothetical protein
MPVEFDQFAVPIERRPAGLTGNPESQVGPAGQVFRAWQHGSQTYLSVEMNGREEWFLLVAAKGRRIPWWN